MVNIEIDLTTKCRACLTEHEEMHYLFGEFDQGISLSEILEVHTGSEVSANDGLSFYLCETCTTTLVQFHNFKTQFHENELYVKSLCASSVVTYKDPEEVVEEVEVHDVEEAVQENEPTTSKQFEITSSENFSCDSCGVSFFYKEQFEKHKTLEHKSETNKVVVSLIKEEFEESKPKTFPCNYCKTIFETSPELEAHILTHKKHVCDQCGAGFTKKSYLRDHAERHSTERKHVCKFCKKAFQRRTVLVKHRRIHTHPRMLICERCGKSFNDVSTLRTHIFLLHEKKCKFHCQICDRMFSLKSTLEKHLRRHIENREKEFVCEVCLQAYNDRSSLNRHMLVKHSSNYIKETCKLCQKEYSTKTNLLKHLRRFHGMTES